MPCGRGARGGAAISGPVGAVLVVGGLLTIALWWWMWDAFARSPVADARVPARPAVLHDGATHLASAFAAAPWIAPPWAAATLDAQHDTSAHGRVLWMLGAGRCAACRDYLQRELADLNAAGVQLRILFAPPPAGLDEEAAPERATLAHVAVRGDWSVFQSWMAAATPAAYYARVSHAPPQDAERRAALTALARAERAAARALRRQGWEWAHPAFFWREEDGTWQVFVGSTPRGRRVIRRALGVD